MAIGISSELFLVATAALLLFLALQKAGAQHRQHVEDIAKAASVPTHQLQDAMAHGVGLTTKFDVSKAEDLIDQRGAEQSRLVLQFVTAALSVGAVVAQQKPISIIAMFEDLAISLFLAWVISSGYNRWWAVSRAPWWLAHAWLTWLEWQVADPSNPFGKAAEDIVLIASLNPHPAFANKLGDTVTYGDAQSQGVNVEREIASIARKWRYRFKSAEWLKWQADVR